MTAIRLMAALSVVTLAAGCLVVAEPMIVKDARPTSTSAYVGGIFSKSKGAIAKFGFGIRDLETKQDYVISVADKDVGLIALRPGRYRVAYWVSFALLTGEQILRQDIPENSRLGRPFDLGPGQVMLLGMWSADRWGYTYQLTPVVLREHEAVAAFRAAYPAFDAAPAFCLICEH